MFNQRPGTRLALFLTSAAVLTSACEAMDGGQDGTSAGIAAVAPALPSAVAARRSPLGVVGKPMLETATGVVVADELLVRFDDTLPGDAAVWLAATAGGEVTFVARRSGYAVVRFADEAAAAAGAARLRESGHVADVSRNHVLHGESDGQDCDPVSGTGLGTSPSYQLGVLQWNLYAMGIDPFVGTPGATGVVVAVLDTGVAYEDHADDRGTYKQAPDLVGVAFAPGWDFVNDDAHPNDDQRHGTHVTGVIAAQRGIQATGRGATILPIKVLDHGNTGTELALVEGIRYAADHGARVINMSLSFPPTYFPSRMLQSAIDYAAQKGVVMIAAVGNHGEDIVAYPAAFRDVIAVGASDIPPFFFTFGDAKKQWNFAQLWLWRAPYSNYSYKVDVLAPAGTIAGDANFDGKPEAVLAQTFAPGDPSSFGYYFYAGTSQAAAQVTGVAATMMAQNPDLDAHAVRGILVENARALGWRSMSTENGRGALRANRAIDAAEGGDVHAGQRERWNANVLVTLHNGSGGKVYARARVEVIEAGSGLPAQRARVYGMFTGAAFGAVSGETSSTGVVDFWSAALVGNRVVAFQADGISRGSGAYQGFDRPRGFLRIESQSLVRLTRFAESLQVLDSGGNEATGFASGGVGGTGLGTSPSYELPTDPRETPVSIAFEAPLFAGTAYRPTLVLPSFSWGLATSPMAVAVDEAWFLATFPGAAARRVVSRGTGVGGSPLRFDDASFPVGTPGGPVSDTPSFPLIVVTFASGTGLGTSPSSTVRGSLFVDRAYSGLDTVYVADVDRLLALEVAAGTGLGTSPSYAGSGPWPFSEVAFGGVGGLVRGYARFADTPAASPAAAYGSALGAAAMPMAPVAPDADGDGLGSQALP